MLNMTITDGTWIKFYNDFETKIAGYEERPRTLDPFDGLDRIETLTILRMFSRRIRIFFEPNLQEVNLPGLDHIGVVPDYRKVYIYQDFDSKDIVCEYNYIDEEGYHYSRKEAIDTEGTMMNREEIQARSLEARAITKRQEEQECQC